MGEPTPEFQTWHAQEPILNLHSSLGEGPYYEREANSLRFVDIKQNLLHTVSLAPLSSTPQPQTPQITTSTTTPQTPALQLTLDPSSVQTHSFPIPLGVTANIAGVNPRSKVLVAGKRGVYVAERTTGALRLLKGFVGDGQGEEGKEEEEEGDESMRANDGAVDPQGRFWVGTMNDFWVGECRAIGTLYRFNSDLSRHAMVPSLRIPNGLGWSLDEKTMYFTHSTERHILAFDYDAPTGDLSNQRVFWRYDGAGEPDGFKMDVDGYLWQAIYGDGKVVRISPEGDVVGEITYPTKCITCPVFIGTELWVTTANDGDEKYGGAIFRVDVGIEGKKEFEFKLDESISI